VAKPAAIKRLPGDVRKEPQLHQVPVIGLFSGAGGLEIGAGWAGADVRLCVDIDPISCQTLRRNAGFHPGTVLQADVAFLDGKALRRLAGLTRSDPCIVIGGPPCQPFSKAAYWTDPGTDSRYRRARARGETAPRPSPILVARPDTRRSLVQEFWRLVLETRARAFLFENVPSITHPRNRPILESLMDTAAKAGFGLTLVRTNAADHGVPQRRQRIFLLGTRGGTPPAPSPSHSEAPLVQPGRLPAVTAGVALAPFADGCFFEPEEVVRGRHARHLRAIPPGANYKALSAWAGHPRPVFEAETRFWHFLLKLSPDRVSWTIPATPGPWTGPFHWDSRRLRIPELAALQGFPADYVFSGSRRERVRQVGNAVPPLLAQRMMECLLCVVGLDVPNSKFETNPNLRNPKRRVAAT
jgi:DNA (cytosine-5)-methyltransferase 1